ncbi:MAG: inositol monophosphatase [Proteobacteria bacterium]|nr:inositol monophosphatase [Pseudomonadota bacterium]
MIDSDLTKLSQLILTAARQELLPRFKNCKVNVKEDGSFITEADLAIQKFLQTELKKQWPEYKFFAEEMPIDEMGDFFAENSDGFWCLDPIDGTSNFSCGLPYFSISLALIKNSKTELGIVYDPIRDECFSAIRGKGAWLNGQPLKVSQSKRPLKKAIALVDIKRLDADLRQRLVLDPPYHSQRSLGSVALDWCWLASERVHVYLHGKMMLWDYAAGLLIAQEAGCFSLGLDGSPVYHLSLKARQAMGAVENTLYQEWWKYLNEQN